MAEIGFDGDGQDSWRLEEGLELAPGRHAVALLGGGRRYEAYLAWDDELHALAVAKLLRPSQIADEEAREVLEAEARALSELAHPILVRGFDAAPDAERPHLLLEFLEGPRVSTLVRRFGMIVEQLLPLALNLCSALHYMHRRGWVHLDVKPRNMIMEATPRLIDLSVARTIEEARRVSAPIGTRLYMAPEQCDPGRFAEIGPPADVFGLGVTLYEAITTEVPWEHPENNPTGESDHYPQLEEEPLPMPDDVPARLAALIESCLTRVPEDRPTPAELAAELERPFDALPPPRIGRFRPGFSWRRRPERAAVA